MNKEGKVLKTRHADTHIDVAVSRVMQNLFATYGEKEVKKSLKQHFNLAPKKASKKAA